MLHVFAAAVGRDNLHLVGLEPSRGSEADAQAETKFAMQISGGGVVMTRDHARRLRHNLSNAELLMWSFLRDFKRAGMHFRRQVAFGPYCADFACHAAKLVVELDGSQHAEGRHRAHDAKRTEFLEGEGYQVVRIWNSELFANPGVIADYVYAIARARLPQAEQSKTE